MPRRNRFTIFDLMDENGVFDSNPANAQSRNTDGQSLYKGPVPYPKMLYHPDGETRVTNPGEIIVTPLGPQLVGVQREIVWELVNNEAEEAKLLAEGWHDHPAKAIAASGEVPPATGVNSLVSGLEAQIAALQAQLRAAEAVKAGDPLAGAKPGRKPKSSLPQIEPEGSGEVVDIS